MKPNCCAGPAAGSRGFGIQRSPSCTQAEWYQVTSSSPFPANLLFGACVFSLSTPYKVDVYLFHPIAFPLILTGRIISFIITFKKFLLSD
jgi:hypothetical protein